MSEMSAAEKTDNQAKTQAKFNFVVSDFNLVISFSIVSTFNLLISNPLVLELAFIYQSCL